MGVISVGQKSLLKGPRRVGSYSGSPASQEAVTMVLFSVRDNVSIAPGSVMAFVTVCADLAHAFFVQGAQVVLS